MYFLNPPAARAGACSQDEDAHFVLFPGEIERFANLMIHHGWLGLSQTDHDEGDEEADEGPFQVRE
jgi:hypothetical protein